MESVCPSVGSCALGQRVTALPQGTQVTQGVVS
jgi:hypothetical protein